MTFAQKFDKTLIDTDVIGVAYTYNANGDKCGLYFFSEENRPKNLEGDGKELGAVMNTQGSNPVRYRISTDPIAILAGQASLSGLLTIYFDTSLDEIRARPIIRIEPTSNSFIESKRQKLENIHRWVEEIYSFNCGGKTSLNINIVDPITDEPIDYDGKVNVKVQQIVDGLPEIFLQNDIDCVDGKGVLEFDSPQSTANLIFKIKPCSEAYYNTKQDDGYERNVLKNTTEGPLGIARFTTLFKYR